MLFIQFLAFMKSMKTIGKTIVIIINLIIVVFDFKANADKREKIN